MNRKFSIGLGLVGALCASGVEVASAEDNKVECITEQGVRDVTSIIPKHFREVRPHTYLIENVPKSKKEYGLGGQLTVYIPVPLELSVFDRTNTDPLKWYNVSNFDSAERGCVDLFNYHLIGPSRPLSKTDAQKKFNAFIRKVKRMTRR